MINDHNSSWVLLRPEAPEDESFAPCALFHCNVHFRIGYLMPKSSYTGASYCFWSTVLDAWCVISNFKIR